MKRIVAIAALAVLQLAFGAYAGEGGATLDELRQAKPKATQTVRQESLELPGLTACHQCEWRPKMNKMVASEQCGTTADGGARMGQFECGFSPDCERVCNFIQCSE
ncbi:MAG: hypothetical protein IT532_02975 [Burkholderiales bacterium]|nr:hypothetical protein [Burkholderiales bacterium]